jgi:polar amino acid transport system substrate-binding protein
MRKILLILTLLGAGMLFGYARAETVTVYTSANFAPLVVGDGGVYADLDGWIQQQGLVRNDAIGEEVNLEKLRLGRVDCVAVAESVARYYMKVHAMEASFQLTAPPSKQTERRFLVPHWKAAVFRQLEPVIRKLRDDPAWQRIMARYE